jgi:hypothetical protein
MIYHATYKPRKLVELECEAEDEDEEDSEAEAEEEFPALEFGFLWICRV